METKPFATSPMWSETIPKDQWALERLLKKLLWKVSLTSLTIFISARANLKIAAETNLGAYGAEKYLSLKKGFPENLSEVPCILPTSHSKLRKLIESYFLSERIVLNVIAETQDTPLQKILPPREMGSFFCRVLQSKKGKNKTSFS